MTVFVVWLVAFAVFLFLLLRAWDGALGGMIKRRLPTQLQGDPAQDRWIMSAALAVLGATFIIKPVSMLLTLILLAIGIWVGLRVACWAMRKANLH
ncbi:MAG: hypothetical protein CMN25_13600 [Salinicola sp.]|uniref:hypothetical protein n=1 Tax=uncultured Salinicola sp. TaxID=1193542 RepID=UPI000C941F96|nr:hypothetical protein [uncultured Salinicola sp.]MAM58366.1 hypothetical protein [Salinicola sp.]